MVARRSARSQPHNTVVFLGAGASRPFGFPLTSDILQRIWNGLHTAKGSDSWQRWGGMKGRRTDARALSTFLQALLPGLTHSGNLDGGTSIIDVISLIDQMVTEGRTPHPSLTVRDVVNARRVLDRALNGVLQGKDKLHYAHQLARWILGNATESAKRRVSVVSTNYDTVVEGALFSRLVRNGISVGGHVDLGMSWRDAFRSQLHQRPQDAHLALFKLHGSLNWLRCELCGYMTVNVRKRIASLDSRETRSPRGYNVCHCGGLLRMLLVTPSVTRDVRDSSLLGIWKAALEDLRSAREWILMGYSLPIEGIAIRSLLLRAWHSRRYTGLKVTVVQHDPADRPCPSGTYQRYRVFFPATALPEKRYLRTGMEPFVDALPLVSELELDARLSEHMGGWSREKIESREKEKALIAKERSSVRRVRHSG